MMIILLGGTRFQVWPVIITVTVFHTAQILAHLLIDNLTVCWLIVRWLARLSSDETYLLCQYEAEHMVAVRLNLCCNLLCYVKIC